MAKVKLHSFLFSLAEKAGIDPKDAGLTEILSNQALDNVELSKELESAINKSLLSVVDAKNNHPEIKTHYFAEIMANVDRSLDDFYREAGLDQKVIDEVSKERSSTKRIALLGTKIKEVVEKAGTSTKKAPELDSLNQQINDLNEKLRIEKEGRKADNDKATGEMKTFRTELALNSKTSGLKTIYDTLPSDVRGISIKNILNKELQDSNADLVLDDNGNLKLQKKDGSNYFDENNRQLSVDDFVNKMLAKNKILVQSAPNSEQPGGSPANNGQPTTVNSSGKSKINVSALMAESLQGLEAEPTKMI
jgi:hypothetical protein